MFIRKLTYKLAPAFDNERGQAEFQRDLRTRIYPLPDLISSDHIPNDDGSWTVVAVWGSRAAADKSIPRIAAAWDELSDRLAGPPDIETGGAKFNQPF